MEDINLNLTEQDVNFTLENKNFTKLFSDNNNADASIKVTINRSGYQSTQPDPLEFEYKTGFFKNKSKIHIGEIVERSLKSIDTDDFLAITNDLTFFYNNQGHIIDYYNPASVNLDIEIKSAVDQSILLSQSFNSIKFAAGRNPNITNNIAFLQYKKVIQRVTKSSIVLFNFISSGSQTVYIYRNTEQISAIDITSAGYKLRAMLIRFDNCHPGDKILITTNSDYFGASSLTDSIQEYIVMPECEHHNTILYEDEYKTLRAFTCTGEWQFSSDYERFTSSRYKNLTKTDTLNDTIKQQSLKIHTGYIPADNQIIVDQIKRAKKAWLLDNDNRSVVELVPNNEEHLNYDSDNDLYDYQLKFIINKKHDLQNYS